MLECLDQGPGQTAWSLGRSNTPGDPGPVLGPCRPGVECTGSDRAMPPRGLRYASIRLGEGDVPRMVCPVGHSPGAWPSRWGD